MYEIYFSIKHNKKNSKFIKKRTSLPYKSQLNSLVYCFEEVFFFNFKYKTFLFFSHNYSSFLFSCNKDLYRYFFNVHIFNVE